MTEQMVENKAVADSYYQAGVRGDLPAFGDFLDENFTVTAPNYVPWGGTHHGAAFFRNALRDIGDIFDFSRFGYEELIAEGDHVVALFRVRVSGTDATVTISGHWTTRNGKALSIWAIYFEPQPLLEKLGLSYSALAS
jgi:ketosteroid isomerase-like protein